MSSKWLIFSRNPAHREHMCLISGWNASLWQFNVYNTSMVHFILDGVQAKSSYFSKTWSNKRGITLGVFSTKKHEGYPIWPNKRAASFLETLFSSLDFSGEQKNTKTTEKKLEIELF